MKKIFIFGLLLILIIANASAYLIENDNANRIKAIKLCDNVNGQQIFFGKTENRDNFLQIESICMANEIIDGKEKQHIYYFLIKE